MARSVRIDVVDFENFEPQEAGKIQIGDTDPPLVTVQNRCWGSPLRTFVVVCSKLVFPSIALVQNCSYTLARI